MKPSDNPDFDDHELVVPFSDDATGLVGMIAVHSTARGPAIGGCRLATYISQRAALTDALRLSRGMSYKNALAGLPAGGGKAVLYKVRPGARRAAVFEAFAREVERLGGAYVTAEDVGTTVEDMERVALATRHVAGRRRRDGAAGGDPSPWTALGVFLAIEAAAGGSVRGLRVAVQGLGAVGAKLCARLHAANAALVVADPDASRVADACSAFGAEAMAPGMIHKAKADVFSPNALGAGLNIETIPDLQAPIVCGGANNQLATPADGQALHEAGRTYVPDYVANAGGIINVVAEHLGEPQSAVVSRVHQIPDRVRMLLERSRRANCPPHEIADALARERLARPAARSVA